MNTAIIVFTKRYSNPNGGEYLGLIEFEENERFKAEYKWPDSTFTTSSLDDIESNQDEFQKFRTWVGKFDHQVVIRLSVPLEVKGYKGLQKFGGVNVEYILNPYPVKSGSDLGKPMCWYQFLADCIEHVLSQ